MLTAGDPNLRRTPNPGPGRPSPEPRTSVVPPTPGRVAHLQSPEPPSTNKPFKAFAVQTPRRSAAEALSPRVEGAQFATVTRGTPPQACTHAVFIAPSLQAPSLHNRENRPLCRIPTPRTDHSTGCRPREPTASQYADAPILIYLNRRRFGLPHIVKFDRFGSPVFRNRQRDSRPETPAM